MTFKSSPLKPLNQIKANMAEMVLGWSPFNSVSDSPALHSKWLLLLKKRNFFSCHFLLYYKSKLAQILTAATWQ